MQVVGATILGDGIYNQSLHFHENRDVLSSVNLLGPVSTTVLYVFYSSTAAADPVITVAGILTISRGVAIVALVIGTFYLIFRSRTHSSDYLVSYDSYWEEQSNEEHEEEDYSVHSWSHLLIFFTFVILLIAVSDTLFQCIALESARYQALQGFFLLPLATRFWLICQNITEACLNHRERAVDKAYLPVSHMFLIIAPCWVLIGWIVDKPVTLLLDLPSTAMYGIAVCTSVLIREYRSHYLAGLKRIFLYFIMSLATILFITSEDWPGLNV